jgi:hypothetical protein
MLFLYFTLAKQEEKICLAKFSDRYAAYLEGTGMFFPKRLEKHFPRLSMVLPKQGLKRMLTIGLVYFMYLSIVIGVGFGMKSYALSKMTVLINENEVVVSVAPLSLDHVSSIVKLVWLDAESRDKYDGLSLDRSLIYVLPAEWGIPELGIRRKGNTHNYLLHPETHGNSLKFDPRYFTVLVTKPILPDSKITGKNILKQALGFVPYLEISVDLEKEAIMTVTRRTSLGQWDGIPVPIY